MYSIEDQPGLEVVTLEHDLELTGTWRALTQNRHSVRGGQEPPGLELEVTGIQAMQAELHNPKDILPEVVAELPPSASVPSTTTTHIRRSDHELLGTNHFSQDPRPRSSERSRQDRLSRLAELTHLYSETCTPSAIYEAPSPDAEIARATEEEQAHAHQLLVRLRTSDPKYKAPSAGLMGSLSRKSRMEIERRSNPENFQFTKKELNKGLKDALHDGAKIGVIESLITMGADINIEREATHNAFKKLRRSDTVNQRSDYMKLAAGRRQKDLVCLLAIRGADWVSLSEGLDEAVRRSYPEIVQALLQHGANPNAYQGQIFGRAVQSGNVKIVNLLLHGQVKVQELYVTTHLTEVVGQSKIEMASLLLENGANINYKNGAALQKATLLPTPNILLVLLNGKQKPTSENLNNCVRILNGLSDQSTALEKRQLLLEILLCAGAQGDACAAALINAVSIGHLDTVSLLLSYEVSVNYEEAKAIDIAVSRGDVNMVRLLLSGSLDKEWLGKLFESIPTESPREFFDIASLLLSAGATGTTIASALIGSVLRKDLNAAALLVEYKASVDFNGGQALQVATTAGDVAMVEILLNGRPEEPSLCTALQIAAQSGNLSILRLVLQCRLSKKSLSTAIPFAMQLTDSQLRIHVMEVILQADASSDSTLDQQTLDQALLQEMQLGKAANLDVVSLLLSHGANVNYQEGQVLRIAASGGLIRALDLLAGWNPNVESLGGALCCAMEVSSDGKRLRASQIILGRGFHLVPPEDFRNSNELQRALVAEVSRVTPNQELVNLLLEKGSTPSWNDGEALQIATMSGLVDILRMLVAKQRPSEVALAKSLPCAIQLATNDGPFRRQVVGILLESVSKPLESGLKGDVLQAALNNSLLEIAGCHTVDRELLTLLLQHGANDSHLGGACFLHAIKTSDNETLKILVKFLPSQGTIDGAFDMLVDSKKGMIWSNPMALEIVDTILGCGVNRARKNSALVQASMRCKDPLAREFMQLLLERGASVNTKGGICLQNVAQECDFELAQLLLRLQPSEKSISDAFLRIFLSSADEVSVFRMARLFLNHNTPPNFKNYGSKQESPLALALTRYSDVQDIAQLLIDAGCSVNAGFVQASTGEEVTPLLWVLSQLEEYPRHALVSSLIRAGANVNYRAVPSGNCPLIAASKTSGVDVVGELIDCNAEVSVEDSEGRTPLSFAAERGQLEIMDRLTKAGAQCNDQSLHYAARNLQAKSVKFLLDHDADPDYPSTRPGGLTALGEICTMNLGAIVDLSALKNTIHLLVNTRTDLTTRFGGKSILLQALDNAQPYKITEVLLESGLRKSINDECHMFQAPGGLCYSPSMYVKKNKNAADASHKSALLSLLERFHCEDKFYNSGEGDQPAGACGLPQWVQDRERRKAQEQERRRAREHEEQLWRQQIEIELKLQKEKEAMKEREQQRQLELLRQQRELIMLQQQSGATKYGDYGKFG